MCDTANMRNSICPNGFPRWFSGKESTCQCRRHEFNPWVGKIPWRRKWQPTPVFLTGKSHGQRSLVGYSPCSYKESDTTEQLSQHTFAPINNVLHPVRKQSRVSPRDKNKYCMEVEVKLLSRVRLFATPRTVAYQAPPSKGFSRQEY